MCTQLDFSSPGTKKGMMFTGYRNGKRSWGILNLNTILFPGNVAIFREHFPFVSRGTLPERKQIWNSSSGNLKDRTTIVPLLAVLCARSPILSIHKSNWDGIWDGRLAGYLQATISNFFFHISRVQNSIYKRTCLHSSNSLSLGLWLPVSCWTVSSAIYGLVHRSKSARERERERAWMNEKNKIIK